LLTIPIQEHAVFSLFQFSFRVVFISISENFFT
jgi:hypothetical protein